jgi:hypothetical protein
MAKRVKRLTPNILKKMIMQEARKLRLEVLETGEEDSEKVADKAPEVDADEFADSIEQDIDWMKALKIHERLLKKKLKRLREAKNKISRRLTHKI